MTNPHDFMDDYYFEFEETQPLSEQEQERIAQLALKNAGITKCEVKKMKKKKFVVLIAAAALGVCALTAGAVNHFNLDNGILSFLKPAGQKQIEQLNSAAVSIDKQATVDGWTLDVRGCLGDQNHMYILFDMIAPQGTILDQDSYSFESPSLFFKDGPMGMGWNVELLADDDKTDNKVSFAMDLDASEALNGTTGDFRLDHFRSYSKQEYQTIKDAHWEVKDIKFSYENLSQHIKTNQQIDIFSGESKITDIYISPLSVTIEARGQSIKNVDQSPPSRPDLIPEESREQVSENVANGQNNFCADLDMPVVLNLKDGTTMELRSSGSSIGGHGRSDRMTKTCIFNRMIDVGNIASITVCDVEIPIDLS